MRISSPETLADTVSTGQHTAVAIKAIRARDNQLVKALTEEADAAERKTNPDNDWSPVVISSEMRAYVEERLLRRIAAEIRDAR